MLTACEQDQDATSCSCSQAVSKPVWHIPLLCVQWKTPNDRQRSCPKHVEFYSKNKLEKLVHLVGFIIRLPTLQLAVGAVQRPWLTAKGQWLANWIIQPVLIVTFSMHNFRHSIASMHKYWTLDHAMNQKLEIELSKERNRKRLFQRIFYLPNTTWCQMKYLFNFWQNNYRLSPDIPLEFCGFLLNIQLRSND